MQTQEKIQREKLRLHNTKGARMHKEVSDQFMGCIIVVVLTSFAVMAVSLAVIMVWTTFQMITTL